MASGIRLAGALLFSLAAGFAAQANDRARQTELFAAMLEAPDDLALMLEYARVSVAIEDFEAAISTLVRALIFQPGDAAIQAELGAAYFRLGSYTAAQAYFEAARGPGLPPAMQARIDDYLAAIDARTRRSRFSGTLGSGVAYSSNATLGPDDPNVIFGGRPVTIDQSFTAESSAGLRFTADVRHRYDLGRPNLDAWVTDVSAYSLSFFSTDLGDVASLGFITGPSLALDDASFGPRIRPFIGGRTVRSQGAPLFNEVGGGSEFSWGVDRNWSVFGRLGAGYRDYLFDRNAFDAVFIRGATGAAYAPDRATTLFATLLLERDSADSDAQSNTEFGLRLTGVHDYAPGIEGVDGLWSVRGYAQVSRRLYDEPDARVSSAVTRRDTDFRIGASHLFRIRDGFGLQFDVDAVNRDSSLANYDFDSVTGVISAIFEF
jgi:hypothetical protein